MYEIVRRDEADEALQKQVTGGLEAYNDLHSPHLREARKAEKAARTLDLFVLGEDGTVKAGLMGRLLWSWSGEGFLYVSNLWVHESLRGQDYGSRLLRQAEDAAQEAGCRAAYLTTFSFQARPFYEKQGYRCVGALENYPPGHSYYWMAKQPL